MKQNNNPLSLKTRNIFRIPCLILLVSALAIAVPQEAQAGSLSSQEADTVSTGRTAAISSAAENETAQNAEAAFREFLDESRSLTWHNDNVTFHFISRENFFAEGEEFMIRDLIDRVDQAAKNVAKGSTDASSETGLLSVKYALLDTGSLPLLDNMK